MGSFSVGCSGSGMSITSGNPCVFIPLIPSNNFTNSKDRSKINLFPMSMIVTNHGSNALYNPFSLPIFGIYNDYGSLEENNIIRTSTVEELERFFNITIDQFMEVVTRNWCEDNTEELKDIKNKELIQNLSGCFINREIYDFMSNNNSEFESNGFLDGADVNTETLKVLKFLKFEDDKTKERYNQVWKMIGDFKNTVYSDGTWSHINNVSSLYHPKAFIEEWNKVSDVKIDSDPFKKLSKYEFVYDSLVDQFINDDRYKDDNNNPLAVFTRMSGDTDITHKLPIYEWSKCFKLLYFERMKTKDSSLKKEFLDFFNVQNTMFDNNKLFMPAFNGPQCGDPKEQLKLAKKMVQVLSKKVKDRM